MTGPLQEVRQACAVVARRAAQVRIVRDAIPAYAASLAALRPGLEMDPSCHYLGHGVDTVAYLVTLDAVNFGSGYFPSLYGPERSGYRAVASRLSEHFRRHGPPSARELAGLTAADCAAVFGLEPENPLAAELAALFTQSLNDLGDFLVARHGGDFLQLVKAAGNSVERLVDLLQQMPLYRDVATHAGQRVPFYKRAQITAADLFIAFAGEGPGRFFDIDRLTLLADNLVPHVLRLDGILVYDPDLADAIDRGSPLPAGSAGEVEIRACAVHVGELLVAELRRQGEEIDALRLDNFLWHRGQQARYRRCPRHRTRTVFY